MPAQSFVVRIDGRSFDIEVEPRAGGPARVRVDGVEVNVERSSGSSWRVSDPGGTESTRVMLDDDRRPAEGSVAGERFQLEVMTAAQAALESALGRGSGATGSGRVTAPMPGRVVKVLVAAGEEVAAGAPVVIVEAMKMENELQAAAAGTVKQVIVAEGDTVDAGALLVEIEAHAPPS